MKKTITTLLILFLTLGLFAETGYNGHQWFISKTGLLLSNKVKPGTDKLWNDTEAEKRPILGDENTIYYHFAENSLYAVSYCIKAEKTDLIRKKMPAPVYEIKTKSIPIVFVLNDIPEDIEDENLYLNNKMATSAFNFELYGYSQLKAVEVENGEGTISIYDYNNDTRVYIFENSINRLTFVVYAYHEQDY